MTTLQAADVAALRCRFVNDIYKYVKCLSYSVNCCLDDAKRSFLDYKLGASTCDLTVDQLCDLQNKAKNSLVVDCMTEQACTSQALIEVRVTETGDSYQSSFITTTFDTDPLPLLETKSTVSLSWDSIVQKAFVNVGVYDQNLNVVQNHVLESGTAKVLGVEVTDPIYDLRVSTYFTLDGISNLASSYLRKVRVYYTDPIGTYVPGQYWDIDVSPITSPYLSGPGMITVSAADLYFTSPNWTTAIDNVLRNAMYTLLGHLDNYMDFYATKAANIDRLTLASRTKHNPSGYWAGLNHLDFRVEYFNALKGLVVVLTNSSTPAPVRPEGGNIYGAHTFTIGCGTIDVELANTQIVLPLNAAATRFNYIDLISLQPTQTVTLTTNESLDCTATVLKATVTSSHSVTLVQWLNPALTIIGTGFTYTHSSALAPGTYTCRVTLSSECVIDYEFEIQ